VYLENGSYVDECVAKKGMGKPRPSAQFLFGLILHLVNLFYQIHKK